MFEVVDELRALGLGFMSSMLMLSCLQRFDGNAASLVSARS